MENIEDLIKLLTEKCDIIKSVKVEFSAPKIIKTFNVEYFRSKMQSLPGGVIID